MSEIKGFHYFLKNLSVQFIGYILKYSKQKPLKSLKFQGFEWWMIRGSNWVYFFRRNAVSVEKKGVDIV